MICTACGYENVHSARFCGECGDELSSTVSCPACGTENALGQKFCNGCGDGLSDVVRTTPEAQTVGLAETWSSPPRYLVDRIRTGLEALEGERKQVSVLFADVLGSMNLAEQSDPEAWRGIMDRFFSILCDGVHRFEGTVDKFTGDGIMAIFGAPIAHEDHARRACYAALNLQVELAAYAAELRRDHGLNFSVRMGLNSGEVVVGAIGDDLSMAYTAVGHTVGLAQRMEQLAEPSKIYVSEQVAALTTGHFTLKDLGEFAVRGASGRLRVYELMGVGAAGGRLDVSRARGLSRFVGRNEELRALVGALDQSIDGRGQVIGIVGEAGVGKSRLCYEFAEICRARGVPVYHAAGQAHAQSVPLLPVLQYLREYFDIAEQDSDQTARERIAGRLLLLDTNFEDDLPLLFDFLAVPDPERPAPRMDPEARQRRLLELMKRLSHAASTRQPAVNVFEDLHWLDDASAVFLTNRVEAVPGTPGLTVLNFRPEYHAPWMSHSYYRQLALAPLGREAVEQLLAELLGSDPSLDGLAGVVLERTAGNPFFIEELVQALIEAGGLEGERGAFRLVRPVDEVAVPATVQAVLAARIDRLGQREKHVLQAAAVVGKEFAQPVLEAVVRLPAAELEEALRVLVAAEFVYEHEVYPEAVYAFKHPLTQEVAYRSQLAERRAPIHAAVAEALAARNPERLDELAALLAQHWQAAGETLEAARWHARAAAWSGYGDPRHALVHWREVRRLADELPETEETLALRLAARAFLLQLGWRLGTADEDLEPLLQETERLAADAGDLRSRVLAIGVSGNVRGLRDGDVPEFARLTRRALAMAEESGDAAAYVAAAASNYGIFCAGELREASAVCDRAIELAAGDPTVGQDITGSCTYAWCHAQKGGCLTYLGELEEARRLIEQSARIARAQKDIEQVGFSYQWAVGVDYFRGDPDAMLGHAQQALEIAERIGSPFSRAWSWLFLGFAEHAQGAYQDAVTAFERSTAIATEHRTTAEARGLRLGLSAEAHLGAGQEELARDLAERGVSIARAQGHVIGELYACLSAARVLTATEALAAEIEAPLIRALELVEATGAKAFEPMVHVERAALARRSGEQVSRVHELGEALRLFTEIGASHHAERLASELAVVDR